MIGRRATAAGITTELGNHGFRATGITAYLKNDGILEKAAQLCDRRREELSLDKVEKICEWIALSTMHSVVRSPARAQ